ncbi:multifunctional expression regulator [Vespertilionid gammaherpesvirus 1]|uniref:Multifunctional expression regulator n=1 Tax=Vespertilionid gammaherpesvirus 1 TaxID=2560830 RepID=A0A0X9YAZ1_9GAMA|nr:multifunctional expression regulator [Myotis gammaherpesvirus 8]AMA67413.1 multifunctional expression regulator [Vespertilionid gammaherpesvirus 1]
MAQKMLDDQALMDDLLQGIKDDESLDFSDSSVSVYESEYDSESSMDVEENSENEDSTPERVARDHADAIAQAIAKTESPVNLTEENNDTTKDDNADRCCNIAVSEHSPGTSSAANSVENTVSYQAEQQETFHKIPCVTRGRQFFRRRPFRCGLLPTPPTSPIHEYIGNSWENIEQSCCSHREQPNVKNNYFARRTQPSPNTEEATMSEKYTIPKLSSKREKFASKPKFFNRVGRPYDRPHESGVSKTSNRDTVRDSYRNTARNNPRDEPRNNPRDEPRNNPRDEPRNNPRDTNRDGFRVAGRDCDKNVFRDDSRENPAPRQREPYSPSVHKNEYFDSASYKRRLQELDSGILKMNVKKSLMKMNLPKFMLRSRDSSPPCDKSIMPPPIPAFLVPGNLRLDEFEHEMFTDSVIQAMVNNGRENLELLAKTVSMRKIREQFLIVKKFATSSHNFTKWVNLRKSSIQNHGFLTMVAFLEETIAWVKLNLENSVDIVAERDIIIETVSTLCIEMMQKLKTVLCCLEDERKYIAVEKQLCYLVCGANRYTDAGYLLKTIKAATPMSIFMAYVLAVPMMMYTNHFVPEVYDHFCKYIRLYEPGTLCSLCNLLFASISPMCIKEKCDGNIQAVLGSDICSRGLFFMPTI